MDGILSDEVRDMVARARDAHNAARAAAALEDDALLSGRAKREMAKERNRVAKGHRNRHHLPFYGGKLDVDERPALEMQMAVYEMSRRAFDIVRYNERKRVIEEMMSGRDEL